MSSTIYIIDGGVFSPPTKATGQLAFNISSFISSKHPKKKYNTIFYLLINIIINLGLDAFQKKIE